jgi:hypothetical protein
MTPIIFIPCSTIHLCLMKSKAAKFILVCLICIGTVTGVVLLLDFLLT